MKIGIDGGGTKTECILIDVRGKVLARHTAPGCNPSVTGPERAREVLRAALRGLAIGQSPPVIARTLLCMAGNRTFWREAATALAKEKIYGPVETVDDSLPVLELATGGGSGLVLHAGTGSFVAARDAAGKLHYAGGLGWRLGDPGSGYELGRLAIVHALIELQGWAPPTRLTKIVCDATQLTDASAIAHFVHQHAEPNQQIAALAPAVLQLATEGDPAARQLLLDACQPLLELAQRVATKLFPDVPPKQLRAGLSGPILTHPVVVAALESRSPLSLFAIAERPIEGVRRLLIKP
ncbi:MAG TPA: BadF/BadG/BcrA/BcrD ATPase family protein [Opitutaceae bacterium]|jgi:glucosamine kinase|nr:BadF/BadG/BcrA/BcrD ATPase family protein [Opitutaceae bacterium]